MQPTPVTVQSKYKGFTLVEVVMTLIIGALLLTTASYYLYSILNIYERTRKNPAFDEHVQNVTLFLSHALLETQDTHYFFENTSTEKEKTPTKPNQEVTPNKPKPEEKKTSQFPTIAWKHLPGASDYDTYFLSFTLYTPNPLVQTPNFPNYPTIAYLEFIPEKGLYLVWHISKTYYKDNPLPVYRTLISPYVKQVTYLQFNKDKASWSSTTENPDNEDDAKNPPQIIRITFSDESNSETGTILVNTELSMEEFL